MLSLLTGMSMMPDEDRPLNSPTLKFTIPFSREDDKLMHWYDYDLMEVTVNGESYLGRLPEVLESDTTTTVRELIVHSFDPIFDVELRLVDVDGRRSDPTIYNFNFNPGAPINACQ